MKCGKSDRLAVRGPQMAAYVGRLGLHVQGRFSTSAEGRQVKVETLSLVGKPFIYRPVVTA